MQFNGHSVPILHGEGLEASPLYQISSRLHKRLFRLFTLLEEVPVIVKQQTYDTASDVSSFPYALHPYTHDI